MVRNMQAQPIKKRTMMGHTEANSLKLQQKKGKLTRDAFQLARQLGTGSVSRFKLCSKLMLFICFPVAQQWNLAKYPVTYVLQIQFSRHCQRTDGKMVKPTKQATWQSQRSTRRGKGNDRQLWPSQRELEAS